MATEVKLPRLGQGMESGTIVKWLKAEGEPVKKREPLYELDTDKVTQEVEADSDGVLLKIVVADGEVDVGTTVGIIGAQDEDVSALADAAPSGNGDAPTAAQPPVEVADADEESDKDEPAEQEPARAETAGKIEIEAPEPVAQPRADGERVKASPLGAATARPTFAAANRWSFPSTKFALTGRWRMSADATMRVSTSETVGFVSPSRSSSTMRSRVATSSVESAVTVSWKTGACHASVRRRAIVLRVDVSSTISTSVEAGAAAAGAAGRAAAFSTSSAMTRPSGPVPAICAMSTPRSRAIRRASGLAFTCSPDVRGVVDG